jgi:O-antigen/teichoic acid export membrane protein
MRKWIFFLGILAVVFIIIRLNSNKEHKSPFLTRINEAVTIAVWALLIAYLLTLGYYLYTTFFK